MFRAEGRSPDPLKTCWIADHAERVKEKSLKKHEKQKLKNNRENMKIMQIHCLKTYFAEETKQLRRAEIEEKVENTKLVQVHGERERLFAPKT